MMIRKARDEDLPDVIRIWMRNIYSAVTPETIEFWFERNKRYFFVCEIDGKIVGFIGGHVKSSERIHISGIAVDAEFRGRGIGSMLLLTFEQESKKDGFKKITLEVRKSNLHAIRLYEKMGFKLTGLTPRYYFDGEDALNYEKGIAP